MSFYDFLHKFFGDRHGYTRPPEADSDENSVFNKPSGFFWDPFDEENNMRDFPSMFGFNTITDPFEMNKHFERTFSEMKNLMEEFSRYSQFDSFESLKIPAIEENQDPRDHYLKPEWRTNPDKERTQKYHSERPSISSSLDSIIPTTPGLQDGTSSSQPRGFFSYKKITRKSVMLPDGTVKTEEIVTSSDGNEQRTEIHTLPDGSNASKSDFSISDLFLHPKPPEIKAIVPRDHFLKPGYEKFNPNDEKIDKDLDKQILQSGVESLPSFSEQLIEPPTLIQPNDFFSFKSFVTTLPNGVVEKEEIIHYPDGTEERKVSQTSEWNSSSGSVLLKGVKDFFDHLFK